MLYALHVIRVNTRAVAVLAFKAAITFELTRRQNDKRMRALHVTMKDLMSVVGL